MTQEAIDIQDTRGHVATITASNKVPLQEVAELAINSLKLPLRDRHGRDITYALFHQRIGRFLNLEVSLLGHDLAPGDRLRILAVPFGKFFELELMTEPNPGMLYPMAAREASIGRDFSNDVVIRAKSISRQHGHFEWQDGFHIYLDADSANGSWINHQPVTQPTPLADGDILKLGNVAMIYRERLTGFEPDANQLRELIIDPGHEDSRTGLMDIPKVQAYLSYSPGQGSLAEVIATHMSKAGIKIWQDVDDISQTLQRTNAMIAILSREAVSNDRLQAEWREYFQLRKPTVVVLFEPCRLPDEMEKSAFVVEYHYNDAQLAGDVLEALQNALE
jgi:hypothetical protein